MKHKLRLTLTILTLLVTLVACNDPAKKLPPPAPTVTLTLTLSADTITAGDTVTLEYDAEHADSVQLVSSNPAGKIISTSTRNIISLTPASTTTYTLIGYQAGRDAVETAKTVTVLPRDSEDPEDPEPEDPGEEEENPGGVRPPIPDVVLTVQPFKPGALSTTAEVHHPERWRVFGPTWFEFTPASGTGPTTVTVTFVPQGKPDAYPGFVNLEAFDPAYGYDIFAAHEPLDFTYPHLTGTVTGGWMNAPATFSALASPTPEPTPMVFPASPPAPDTPGTLIVVLEPDSLHNAALTLEGHADTLSITILESLDMILVTSTSLARTLEASEVLPGFIYAEEEKPQPISHDQTTITPLEWNWEPVDTDPYTWSQKNYFGNTWRLPTSADGHLTRSNAFAAQALGLTGAGVTIAVVDAAFHGHLSAFDNTHIIGQYPIDGVGGPGPLRSPPADVCDNSYRHGTLVAQGITGAGPAGQHQSGIAPGASLLFVDTYVLVNNNGSCQSVDTLLSAINWLLNDGAPRAKIMNNSWGFVKEPSPTMMLAFQRLHDAGVIIVSASGNDRSGPVSAPARFPTGIAVAGFGGGNNEPRRNYTTNEVLLMGIEPLQNAEDPANPTPTAVGGTSVATPQVSATIALMLEAKPTATLAEIRQALQLSAHKAFLPAGASRDDNGYGVLDVHGAIMTLLNPSFVPNHQITLSVNGVPKDVTVRPDGTFSLGYIEPGTHTISGGTPHRTPQWTDSTTVTLNYGDAPATTALNLRR